MAPIASLSDLRRIPTSSTYRSNSLYSQESLEDRRHTRLRRTSNTAVLTADPFDDCYRVRRHASLNSGSIYSAGATSLTSTQIDKTCDAVDIGLSTPGFYPSLPPYPAPETAPNRTTSSSVRVDLARLAAVILYQNIDGSPKGLSFLCKQGSMERAGDCVAEPGRMRVWLTQDLKHLVYVQSTSEPATCPPCPGYFRIHDIGFAAQVDRDQTALEMSGMMSFRFDDTGLSLRLDSLDQAGGAVDISPPWYCDPLENNGKVAANMSGRSGSHALKNENWVRKIVQCLVGGRAGKQPITRRAGHAIKRITKRSSANPWE